MDHLREAESPAAPAVKVADGTPPPTAELPVLPTHYCKDMIYYFGSFDLWKSHYSHKFYALVTFLIKNWKEILLHTLKNLMQKFEGNSTMYLEKCNLKNGRKFYYSQKLYFDKKDYHKVVRFSFWFSYKHYLEFFSEM